MYRLSTSLLASGVLFMVLGAFAHAGAKFGISHGMLPAEFRIERNGRVLCFSLASSLLSSIALTAGSSILLMAI